jgi:hypothetical protein
MNQGFPVSRNVVMHISVDLQLLEAPLPPGEGLGEGPDEARHAGLE